MGSDFGSVTEEAGFSASPEQADMLHTRYKLAREIVAGKTAAEVACGTGIGAGYLAAAAKRFVAGEYDSHLVAKGRRHYGGRVEFVRLDAHALPARSGALDAVVLLEAIYYLPNPNEFLREAHRVLRPGGALLICWPNPEHEWFVPSPLSVAYWTAAQMKRAVEAAGFSVALHAGFGVDERKIRASVIAWARRAARRLSLFPTTMKAKSFVKRMLYRGHVTLPAEFDENFGHYRAPSAVRENEEVRRFRVLYMTGRKDR